MHISEGNVPLDSINDLLKSTQSDKELVSVAFCIMYYVLTLMFPMVLISAPLQFAFCKILHEHCI